MKINITDAKKHIISVMKAGLVPNLLGSPGLGKSDIIREIAEEYNLEPIDFRLAQADPTDLNGFPCVNEDRTRSHYAPPTTFPLEGDALPKGKDGWLLFFDEMNAAPNAVQAASYKLILDRAVGSTPLHNNVRMMCAGNLATDKAIVNRLSTAMQSRLVHFTLEAHAPSWISWAIKNKVDYRVIAFIRFRPDLIHKFDANHSDNTFPCPRTWYFLSKIINKKKKVEFEELPLIEGTIGEGTAMEFIGFISIFDKLPTPAQILLSPGTIDIPDEPSILYALSALVSNIIDEDNFGDLMNLINRLPIEFQTITIQNILAKKVDIKKAIEYKLWIKNNAKELI